MLRYIKSTLYKCEQYTKLCFEREGQAEVD